MEKICKNCKWWDKLFSYKESGIDVGACQDKHFINSNSGRSADTTNCLTHHNTETMSNRGITTGQNFGCIHFKEKG